MTIEARPTGRFAPVLAPLRSVARNPGLRRVVGAYIGFNIGEWATWIAILVYAFEQGGATEAGVVALVQLAPAAVVAPLAASLGDHFRRERALFFGYAVQAVTMTVTAGTLLAGAPNAVVYAAAAATATAVTLTRPVHGSILPSLAGTPAELTAANVASGTVTNASLLVAPAIAGLILETAGPGAVFAVTAVGCAIAAALIATLRIERTALDAALDGGHDRSPLAELSGGFRAIAALPRPRTVVVLLAAEAVVEGAIDIFIVVLALDLLRGGESTVGYLNSAVGAGGLMGAALAVGLVGRTRLARPFAAGLLLASAPLAVTGLLPQTVVAYAAMVSVGLGRSLMDVAGRTLLQRVTPDVSLARVFGVLEGLHTISIAAGSVVVSVLIGWLGARNGLLVAAAWLPIVVFLAARALRRTDEAAIVHVRELELLRGLPMFAPLPPPTIERLSATLQPVAVAAGQVVIQQGDPGDDFFVVDDGALDVHVDGTVRRTLGPGAGFGEIALIRNVPRTASVTARTDSRLYALRREVFLAAVAGHPEGRRATEALVSDRLDSTAGRAAEG